jgi:hypothetical protein
MVSAYLLSLNYDKTNVLHFTIKYSLTLDIKLQHNIKSIHTKLHTKFLGIIMDSTLQRKACIDSLLMKINAACYALETLKLIMSHTTSISYGLFFLFPLGYVLWHNLWGASRHSINIFR